MITVAYINFWDQPHDEMWLTKFIIENIGDVKIVKYNENPDILFASVDGSINNVINSNSKCKIFFYGENLNRYPPYNNDSLLQNSFDLIVGFRDTNLEKKHIRLPLWLMYYDYYSINNISGNSSGNDTENKLNIITYIDSKYKENIAKNKTIFASIVAQHDREGQRTKICNALLKYESSKGKIMAPSNFKNNTTKIGFTKKDKIDYISQGIYNICPENSIYEGYFTEKIFQAFEGGTIPIYWAIDLPEQDIINKNKYCFCNINNKKEMQDSIDNSIMHPELYLDGNIFTENAETIIQKYYDDLRDNIKIKLGLY